MSEQLTSVLVVGEFDPHCETLLAELDLPNLRRALALSAVPALHAAQPANVIMLAAAQPSSFDAAIINNLRQQDAAQDRYTCIVQCATSDVLAQPMPLVAHIDDVLLKPDMQNLRLRLALFSRIAALETQLLQLTQYVPPGDVLLQDRLTGLGNWRYLTNSVEGLLLETRDRGGLVCCALLSIDRLDHVTKHHGQVVRSELLRGVASRLRKALRPTDIIARTSDNEFGVALRYANSTQPRPWIFERLLRTVNYPPFVLAHEERELTISIGVCCSDGRGDVTPFDMLAVAGSNMREAQVAGGNALKM